MGQSDATMRTLEKISKAVYASYVGEQWREDACPVKLVSEAKALNVSERMSGLMQDGQQVKRRKENAC